MNTKFYFTIFITLVLVGVNAIFSSAVFNLVFAEQTATTSLVISNVRAENKIGTSAQIKWDTNKPATSRVNYGTSPGNFIIFSYNRCDGGGYVTNHCVNLTDLTPGTVYYYKVISVDEANNYADYIAGDSFIAGSDSSSGGEGGSTLPPPPAPQLYPPSVSGNNVSLSWSSVSGAMGYQLFRSASSVGPWESAIFSAPSSTLSYTDSGLANGTYYYVVQAYNNSGHSDYSNVQQANVSSDESGSRPPAPSSVNASLSQNYIAVSWTMVAEATYYNVYRSVNGTYSASPVYSPIGASLTSYADNNVISGSTYRYKVEACKSGYGCSNPTESNSVTVGSTTDTPPTAPAHLVAVATSSSQINLYWEASTDDFGVVGYKIWRNGSYIGSTNNLYYYDTGLASNTFYNYEVKAYDTANNFSLSAQAGATTLSSVGGGTSYYNLTVSKSGDGTGAIYSAPAGINCGQTCSFSFAAGLSVTLTAMPSSGSVFYGWSGACSGTNLTCSVVLNSNLTVAALFAAGVTSSLNATTSVSDTIPPSVVSFMSGPYNSGNNAIFTVKFSEPIQGEVLNSSNIYLYPKDYPNFRVTGNIIARSDGFDLITPNLPNVDHVLVMRGIKDLWGNVMPDYQSNFLRQHSSCCETYPYPPNVSETPPYVTGWGLSLDPVPGQSVIGVKFNTGIDPSSYVYANLFVYKSSDPPDAAYRLPVTFKTGPDYVMLLTKLTPGVEYINVIKSAVKSSGGISLTSDFSCRFIALSSGYYTTCPGGAVTQAVPPLILQPTETNAILQGTISDDLSKPIAQASIHIFSKDFSKNFGGVTDANGFFKINLNEGQYTVEIFPPAGRLDLLKPALQDFSISNNETKTLNLRFNTLTQLNKTLNGQITSSLGQPITDARVSAYSESSKEWRNTVVDQNGNYTLKLSGGKWLIKVIPIDSSKTLWRFLGAPQTIEFRADVNPETKTLNFVIPAATAKITVKVLDDNNKPLPNAGVILDTASGAFAARPASVSGVNYLPPEFRKSDVNGVVIFFVIPGQYYLRGFLPPESGLMNPGEQLIDVAAGETKEITLVFKKPALATSAVINGITRLEDGTPVDAFVWAWSENGGFQNTKANNKGEFTIAGVLDEKWHLGAGRELKGFPYKSNEIIIEIKNSTVSVELVLSKVSGAPIAKPVSVNQAAAQTVVIQVEDGTKVVVPPAAGGVSGSITVEVKPTIEAPSQAAAKVIGTVYDIKIEDQAGKAVTQLQDEIEITLPYTDEELKAQGVTEDTIVPSYFDETSGVWLKIDNFNVDKEKNIIIARVKHLTRFAIVAAADVTPPNPPTKIMAVSGGPGELILSWVNPPSDFSHVKIYRSTEKGKLGILIARDITAESYKDNQGLSDGQTYYYTVRAVDPAGNESVNTDQVSAVARGFAEKKAPLFSQNLKIGSRGDEVRRLQNLLIKEGVYPEKLATGFFGPLTRMAVIKFQEKYADEILKPLGLTSGTGFVGPRTRAKLNQL